MYDNCQLFIQVSEACCVCSGKGAAERSSNSNATFQSETRSKNQQKRVEKSLTHSIFLSFSGNPARHGRKTWVK